MAMLLLHRNATVSICHSRTTDLPAMTRQADILVAAVGRPAMLTPEYVAEYFAPVFSRFGYPKP